MGKREGLQVSEPLCDAQLCKNYPKQSKPLTGLTHPFSHACIPQMFIECLVGARHHAMSWWCSSEQDSFQGPFSPVAVATYSSQKRNVCLGLSCGSSFDLYNIH